jgi:ABC-2 type transport system permease protein
MKPCEDKSPGVSIPGSATAGWLIARMFFRVTLGGRRIRWIVIALLVPLVLAVYGRITRQGPGLAFFDELTLSVFLHLFALGFPLYLGVSAVRDEIDDLTIVYLFSRPIRRSVIVGAKLLSVALVVSAVLALDLALVYAIVVSADGFGTAMGLGLLHWMQSAAVLALAVAAYTSLFGLFGTLFRRPMLPAMAVGVGWEMVVSNLPGSFPRLTIMFYLKSLLGVGPESSGPLGFLIPVTGPASVVEAGSVVVTVTLLLFAAGIFIGSRKEYRL